MGWGERWLFICWYWWNCWPSLLKPVVMLNWQTLKNFLYVNDHHGDLRIPYNDYVCYVLDFIPSQLVLEINVNWSNVALSYYICEGCPLTQTLILKPISLTIELRHIVRPDPSHVIYFQAICGGLFSIQLVEVRGDCFFGSYCWNIYVILADFYEENLSYWQR